MERQKRDFKGVWIPGEIWLSEQLTLMEKVLFTEIHSLDNERGCFASNSYFAKFFKMSERQIRTHVGSLKDKGLITVTVTNWNQRVIRTVGRYRRLQPEELRELQMRRESVVHSMTLKAPPGVGRKLPGG